VTSRMDLWRAAKLLVDQYGADAPIRAACGVTAPAASAIKGAFLVATSPAPAGRFFARNPAMRFCCPERCPEAKAARR